MDIFPELLGENEFRCFTSEDYNALKDVLNDVLAKCIKDYIDNPSADKELVSVMQEHLGPTIECMTMHLVLNEKGITELVRGLVPENLPSMNIDLDNLIEQLSFLESNSAKLMTSIPKRTRDSWDTFFNRMKALQSRMSMQGIKPTYQDFVDRIKANQFVFYVPNAKSYSTGSQTINMKRRQWIISLRGAEYMKYCNEKNIPYHERRMF